MRHKILALSAAAAAVLGSVQLHAQSVISAKSENIGRKNSPFSFFKSFCFRAGKDV